MKIRIRLKSLKECTVRVFLSVAILLSFSESIHAQKKTDEYDVKALFVLNFIKYVNWPTDQGEDAFIIGIAGDSPLYDALSVMIKNRKENNNIHVEKITNPRLVDYKMLVITESEVSRADVWFKRIAGKGVLTVTEDGKTGCNSAINLVNVDSKIRFEINNSGARLGGVKISSKLADLAISVQP